MRPWWHAGNENNIIMTPLNELYKQCLIFVSLFLMIGTVMYKFNYGLLPDVLNTMYSKNCEIHSYNTRSKDVFRISSGTQTFSNISARIWNSLMVNLDIDVSLIKFKESLKQYPLNNVLIIKYTK